LTRARVFFRWPRTLFGKTATTIAIVLVCYVAFALATLAYYVLVPVAKRSAQDLAALMVLSAQTWRELPPGTRADFAHELAVNHGLVIASPQAPLPTEESRLPYVVLLQHDLSQRVGRPVPLASSVDSRGVRWYWADIPVAGEPIRLGFARDRVGVQVPSALVLLLGGGGLATLLAAVFLVRRLTRPLARLADAAALVGRGTAPTPLPETGATELAQLTQAFNRMARQVDELISNRTILLAGISHDLRTPLARMRFAVEMLPAAADPKLVTGLMNDLDRMNTLIGEFLTLARTLEERGHEAVDIAQLIDQAVADARRAGGDVRWRAGATCLRQAQPLALQRILTNLLDNAVRYGGGKPVAVTLDCGEGDTAITVVDQGPGIPAAEREAVFRPFYRLEGSRSSDTGGSGLGLAIARQLAEANGWRLTLDAGTDGGTCARLHLARTSG
jgi:two-component system osmolarity sensor histidine kinase EnvZ